MPPIGARGDRGLDRPHIRRPLLLWLVAFFFCVLAALHCSGRSFGHRARSMLLPTATSRAASQKTIQAGSHQRRAHHAS